MIFNSRHHNISEDLVFSNITVRNANLSVAVFISVVNTVLTFSLTRCRVIR